MSRRTSGAWSAVLVLATCFSESEDSGNRSPQRPVASGSDIVWVVDHETADLSQWDGKGPSGKADGLITTERGRGTFVTAKASAVDPREQRERLRPMVRQLLSRARLSGVAVEALAELLDEEDQHWKTERDRES